MATAAGTLRTARPANGIAGVLDAIERRVGLTPSGLAVIGVAIVGWVLARIIGSRAMFLLVYGMLLVVILAVLAGRRRLSVEATRSQLPTRMREGQVVEVGLRLVARRRLTTLVLAEELHPHLGASVFVPVPVLAAGRDVEHTYTISPRLRGVYRVGPLVATWSDPFGLTRRRLVIAEPEQIIVHPRTELVSDRVISREWEDPPIRPPISKPWPTGFEFYGMRDYASGDDPRRIIWRATARTLDLESGTGRYLVREAEQGITDRVTIVLDTDTRHHSPGGVSETFELAVRTVASLGARHLRDGFSVTIEANAARIAARMRGARARIPLLDALARANRDRVPLASALDRIVVDPRRNAHNVVVTGDLDEDSARRIRLLLDIGLTVQIVLVEWDEFDPRAAHRAAALGCNVVEVEAGAPLEAVFRKVLGAGIRR
jgi:uncharacterized protein (DUF58 family)